MKKHKKNNFEIIAHGGGDSISIGINAKCEGRIDPWLAAAVINEKKETVKVGKEINISNENYIAKFSLDNGVADYCKLYEIGGDEAGQIKYFEDQSKKIKQLEKALELLKDKNNYYKFVNENTETIDVDLAISKAKEMMKSE